MEVQLTAGGANLLMECEEEEQEIWPPSPERHEEDEEGDEDEDLEVFSLMEEEDSPVRIIPIPGTSSSPPPHSSLECPGAPLGFRLNGRPVRPLPGGGTAELQLRSHPRGSASGFSSVQIHRPADPPIITGVVSAEAAQQVFSLPQPPPTPSDPPWILVSPQTPSPASQTPPLALKSTPKSQSSPPSSRSTSPEPKKTRRPSGNRPLRPLHKGQLGPVPPPDCRVCMSQYKLITELRGFLCLCSSELAQSLKSMKRKKMKGFRRKHKSKKSRRRKKSSKSRPPACKVSPLLTPPHRACDDFLFDSPPSPPSSCTSPPAPPPSDPPQGKLVIMVEDFYYGSTPGRRKEETEDRKFNGPLRCIHCPETLNNNTQLMSHMKDHVSPMSRVGGLRCSQCFRHLPSAFKLQQHMEAVHAQHLSTVRCRICELDFGSEAAFLWHMKSTHRPGEMPYVCQVCGFRSSFYSDVWSHFQKLHSDSKNFLCQYCLRVMRSNNCYQQHFARHQKRHVFSCDKCRLHFLYIRERVEHNLNHRTHIRPPQLVGLKPGTRVTVRTYSVVADSEREERMKSICRVVDVDPPPPRQEALKRNPVKSLGNLLTSISQQRRAATLQLLLSPLSLSVSLPPLLCVECLSTVKDFQTHFPSLVNCSLCRFITCCSTSYANHMINNHATGRKKPLYPVIFKADTRFSEALRCVSCTFTTCRGDLMANHLTERPEHTCIMHTHHGPKSVNGSETQPIHNPHSVTPSPGDAGGAFLLLHLLPPGQPFPQLSLKHLPAPHSVTPSPGEVGGAFLPLHLLPPGQPSPQLSLKHISSPPPLSSPPVMTIRILGSRPPPEQRSSSPLSSPQLVVVLSSLLHGLTYATLLHAVPPQQILSWSHQQEEQLWGRLWSWRSKEVAEWVLRVREQQVRVSDEVLLQLGRSALGEEAPLKEVLSWTVDLLLRHELQPPPYRLKHHRGRTVPRSIKRGSRSFLPQLLTQIQRLPPHCIGSMDEFPIFLDQHLLQEQSPLALRFFGSPEEEPVFHVILSALSDGSFLPPLVLFRGEPVLLPSGFPDNVLLEARQEAVSEQERLLTWVSKVWRPLVVSRWNTQVLLLLDVHLGHLTDQFRGTMSSENTELLFIPPSCSCRLQPLNVCVTPVLRDFLQARWGQLLSEGSAETLSLDQLALTLGCWISEASSLLNAETHFLRRSFSSVSDPQQLEDRGEASKMIFALIEALLQHAEPEPEPGLEPEPKLELLLEDGQAVIDQVREEVDQVPEEVMDQVSEEVDQVSEEVMYQVSEEVDQVSEEVMDQVSEEVDQVSEEVMDQVSEEVDQVSEEVMDQVSEEVDQVSEEEVDQVSEEVDQVSEEVMDQVSEEVDQVSEEVMDQVSEEVDQVSEEVDQFSEEEVLIESQSALEQEFDSDLDSFHSFSDES